MKKSLLIFLAATALGYSTAIHAQSPAPTQVPVATAPATTPPSTMESRYVQCINSSLCPLQVRLQLVREENDDMNFHFHKIYEACAASNFQGCTDGQQGEMDMWHSADYRMGQMMLSIEAQSLALKETAAGGPDKPQAGDQNKKSLWDRIWEK